MFELFVTIFLATKVLTTFSFPETYSQGDCEQYAQQIVKHFKLKKKMGAEIECRLREVTPANVPR